MNRLTGHNIRRLEPVRRLKAWAIVLAAVCGMMACSDNVSGGAEVGLARVGQKVITASDFNRAFDIMLLAYPSQILEKSAAVRQMKRMLLNQLIEEAILMRRAEELEIHLEAGELETAIANIREGYPGKIFERKLIERVIPYRSWEDRIKNRLVVEKVLAAELEGRLFISTEDISRFYQADYTNDALEILAKEGKTQFGKKIIEYVRRQKSEQMYEKMIDRLKTKYPVVINTAQWDKILSRDRI